LLLQLGRLRFGGLLLRLRRRIFRRFDELEPVVWEETHDATHGALHPISGFLQPAHILVFGFGAIAIEGFEFVRRCAERSLGNINAFWQCRTPQDVVAAQGNWVRGHLQDVNREIHRVAEILRELPRKESRSFPLNVERSPITRF
jgi:hypothetical protein